MEIFNLNESQYTQNYGIFCASLNKSQERKGLYPTFCRVPPNGKTLVHSHFEPEVFFIISGRGEIAIGSERKSVKENDIIRLPPFTEHELNNTGSQELTFLSIYSEDFEIPLVPRSALVTAAPPTPNGPLHLGHISGPYLASDIISRYLRQREASVHSHCGTDDHQNYVTEKAHSLSLDPEVFRKKMRERIKNGLKSLNINFDEFIEPKTDSAYQTKILNFTQRAIHSGIIQEESLELPYCAHCKDLLIDSLILGTCPSCGDSSHGGCESCGLVVPPQDLLNSHCTRCQNRPEKKLTSVYTFNLSHYLSDILEDVIHRPSLSPHLLQMIERVTKIKDLKVLISLPNSHGIGLKIPQTNQTLHVWFEMAAHYEQFALNQSSWIHCFGFDNGFYYLLFIPALIKALNPEAKFPQSVLTNEFLLLDEQKFSTSRNHAIWADEFNGNTDHLRLYLSLQRPSHLQSNFSLKDFESFSLNLEIQIQNLLRRASILREKDFCENRHNNVSDKISHRTMAKPWGDIQPSLLLACNRVTREIERLLSPTSFDVRQAARIILSFIDSTLQQKDSGRSEKLMIQTLATIMAPLMPATSDSLLKELNVSSRQWVTDWAIML